MPVAHGACAPRLPLVPPSQWRDEAARLAGRVGADGALTTLVGRFVGAGPGLTPSGDDVLCGVLLGLRVRGLAQLLPRLWVEVVPRLGTTTKLAAALLAEAVEGYALPQVVRVGEALVAGDEQAAAAACAEVATIGHTSGEDLLAGLAGCLDALQDKEFVA